MEGVERVLGDAGADAAERAVVHDRDEHGAVDGELLDLVQQRLAALAVALAGAWNSLAPAPL